MEHPRTLPDPLDPPRTSQNTVAFDHLPQSVLLPQSCNGSHGPPPSGGTLGEGGVFIPPTSGGPSLGSQEAFVAQAYEQNLLNGLSMPKKIFWPSYLFVLLIFAFGLSHINWRLSLVLFHNCCQKMTRRFTCRLCGYECCYTVCCQAWSNTT